MTVEWQPNRRRKSIVNQVLMRIGDDLTLGADAVWLLMARNARKMRRECNVFG
jgi:hypothetical protein